MAFLIKLMESLGAWANNAFQMVFLGFHGYGATLILALWIASPYLNGEGSIWWLSAACGFAAFLWSYNLLQLHATYSYIIKPNRHRCWPLRIQWLRLTKRVHVFVFKVNATWWYDYDDQGDNNKVCGVSYRLLPFFSRKNKYLIGPGHHYLSSRICYERIPGTDKKVKIVAYCYIKGERVTKHLTTIRTSLIKQYSSKHWQSEDGKLHVRLERRDLKTNQVLDYTYRVFNNDTKPSRIGYRLNPRFGGDLKSQHTLRFPLRHGSYKF